MVNDKLPDSGRSFTGQVRALFYLLDEPAATLTIQVEGRTITARAYGAVALDLRALPRGATICATLNDKQLDASTDSTVSALAFSCLHRARRRARILAMTKHRSGEHSCAVQIR
jgi:hypothetical protein